MGSKRLTPTRVGKMASKCLLLLLLYGCCFLAVLLHNVACVRHVLINMWHTQARKFNVCALFHAEQSLSNLKSLRIVAHIQYTLGNLVLWKFGSCAEKLATKTCWKTDSKNHLQLKGLD